MNKLLEGKWIDRAKRYIKAGGIGYVAGKAGGHHLLDLVNDVSGKIPEDHPIRDEVGMSSGAHGAMAGLGAQFGWDVLKKGVKVAHNFIHGETPQPQPMMQSDRSMQRTNLKEVVGTLVRAARRYGKAALIGGFGGGAGAAINILHNDPLIPHYKLDDVLNTGGDKYGLIRNWGKQLRTSGGTGALVGIGTQAAIDAVKLAGRAGKKLLGYGDNPYSTTYPQASQDNPPPGGLYNGGYVPQQDELQQQRGRPYEYSHDEDYQPHIYPQQNMMQSERLNRLQNLLEGHRRLKAIRESNALKEVSAEWIAHKVGNASRKVVNMAGTHLRDALHGQAHGLPPEDAPTLAPHMIDKMQKVSGHAGRLMTRVFGGNTEMAQKALSSPHTGLGAHMSKAFFGLPASKGGTHWRKVAAAGKAAIKPGMVDRLKGLFHSSTTTGPSHSEPAIVHYARKAKRALFGGD